MNEAERLRMLRENRRRDREGQDLRYAPWDPAEQLNRITQRRIGARVLHEAGVFPEPDDLCLEVGLGILGWLAQMIDWGVQESGLHGVDLDSERIAAAKASLPCADLRVANATDLPWEDNRFALVVASVTFTSILDENVRAAAAQEITRVLAPGGALLWYDFAVNNPRNPNVRKVSKKDIKRLFPHLQGELRSVTLAPPLARFVARRSWTLATALESIPILRTHLIGALVKPKLTRG